MTPVEALTKGRDFLVTHKWTKGHAYDRTNESFCAIGALYGGMYGMEYWNSGAEYVDYSLNKEVENILNTASYQMRGRAIVSYNDSIAKRKRDVVAVFNRAIKLAEGAK